MPNALTNTNISATYKGVLHTNGITIPPSGQETVYDGVGAQSSLSLGRTNQGATVSGSLSATDVYAGQLRMPKADNGIQNQVVARTAAGVLELRSLSQLNGGSLLDGTYTNPKITVLNGAITNIESRPIIDLLTAPTSIVTKTKQSMNPYLLYDYYTTEWVYPQKEGVIIPSTDINWYALAGLTSATSARYAILSTKLFLQSNGGDFYVELKVDDKVIAKGEVREDENSLGVDTMYDSTQQLFIIPTNRVSSYTFKVYQLPGSTNNVVGARPNNKLNLFELNVTLDGWVY